MGPLEALGEHRGVADWSTLRMHGVSRRELNRELSAGEIVSVRRGCFAIRDADPVRVAEVAWSGAATCVTAAARWGLPVPHTDRVHLTTAPHRSQSGRNLSIPPHIVRHPHPRDVPVAAIDVMAHAARCLPRVELLCVVDAALNRRLLTMRDVETLNVGSRLREWLLRHADARTQSPLETRARVALATARVPNAFQAAVDGVGRVDFLVSDWLIVEVDGREYHTSAASFANDRRRDRAATELGYRVVRFSYDDVLDTQGFVAAVRAALASPIRPLQTTKTATPATGLAA